MVTKLSIPAAEFTLGASGLAGHCDVAKCSNDFTTVLGCLEKPVPGYLQKHTNLII